MRSFNAFVTAILFSVSCLTAVTADAAGVRQVRKAVTQPQPQTPGCMDHRSLMSHVAYLPTASGPAMRCSRLLSTDTMLTVHRWDRT